MVYKYHGRGKAWYLDTFWDRVDNRLDRLSAKRPWLAKQAGLDLNTMQKRIQNGILPRVDEAARIANVLGVTIDYLQTGIPNTTIEEPAEVTALCEAIRKLPGDMIMRLQGWLSAHGIQTYNPAEILEAQKRKRA